MFSVILRCAGCVLALAVVVTGCGGSGGGATDGAPTPSPVDPAGLVRSAVIIEGIECGRTSIGSGVVTADGILTNAHVVAGVEDLTVRVSGGQPVPAVVLAMDPEIDLAVVAAEGLEVEPLPVARPVGGTTAVALVGGSGEVEILDVSIVRTININIGDIYGEGEYRRRGIELAADIGPGDSGAAVVNEAGEVVGLIFSASSRESDVSYAVSSVEFADLVATVDGTPADVGSCR